MINNIVRYCTNLLGGRYIQIHDAVDAAPINVGLFQLIPVDVWMMIVGSCEEFVSFGDSDGKEGTGAMDIYIL
jgi:hypothetical protein